MGQDRQGRRVALVTGGGRGIGHGCALRLAGMGMDVAVCDLRADLLRQACADVRGKGVEALGVECDVSDEAAVRRAVAEVDQRFGRIDVLVNSAGILEFVDGRRPSVEQTPLDLWLRVLAVNLTGSFLMCREVIPVMKRARWGRIVNIASRAGRTAAGPPAYTASKGGIIALSRVMAKELGPSGITVNCVAPSRISTELVAHASSPEDTARKLAEVPLGRLGEVSDVAGAVAYLASDDASFVTGTILDVSGGSYMP